ncbi:MAG: FAD-dependent monooxygenase [Bacteroidota bacterium]|nr:FAD-dependent monooxygenase [Bacteroidota bacterium]
MVIAETHSKVLIVGAGPSGLMMAAQLLRYGIQPLIIDNKQGPTTHSNALVVQARSLEIYRQMGIADQVIKNGNPVKGASFYKNGDEKATFQLTDIGTGQTAFPFLFLYQQFKNEQVLLDYLTKNCCPVYWNTSLVSIHQTAKQVEVQLQEGEKITKISCDWLIGADGAHSTVRKQLNIPFNGDTYQHSFYLADLELNNKKLREDYIQLFMTRKDFAGFFPMPEANNYRIVGNIPVDMPNELQVEDILPVLDNITGQHINLVKNNWFTIYRLHHRMAEKFREQRCFLIGDAAHIHSPVGGQGMNTGLQDAYNLAWKMAGVINDQYKPQILDTYAAERMQVAKDLLRTTDRVFNLIVSGKWYSGLFKMWVLPRLLNILWNKKGTCEGFFKRVSQISISYRNSPLSLHLSNSAKIKAGDRLPYLKIYDEKKEEETDLHAWCGKPGFTLIILGKFDELFLFTIAKWITNRYANTLNFFYLPPSGKNLKVFDAFEANPHHQMSIIMRPDMHIGFINDRVDIGLMDNYLRNVAGVKG